MSSLPIDPSFAKSATEQQDLVQRKIQMDSLRNRLGDARTEEQRLRESCEGFESIFIQKMWEQMRKNVPKEGYLHSKDEEAYQSMFDVELAKKMTSAGGIGLADMLYQQLSQKNANTAKTTASSAFNKGIPAQNTAATPALAMQNDKVLTPDSLYSELPSGEATANSTSMPMPSTAPVAENTDTVAEVAENPVIASAIAALFTDISATPTPTVTPNTPTAQAISPAQVAASQQNNTQAQQMPQGTVPFMAEATAANAQPNQTEAAKASNIQEVTNKRNKALLTSSWQGNGPVSAKPKPVSGLRNKRKAEEEAKTAEQTAPAAATTAPQVQQPNNVAPAAAAQAVTAVNPSAQPQAAAAAQESTVQETKATASANNKPSMAPKEAQWPHNGKVTSHFGWEDTGAGRRWNSGVQITAQAGDPVKACLDGTVIYSGPREGYGNTVVLQHQDGYLSYYGNVAANQVKVGDNITAGTNFATVEISPTKVQNGENSSALHFELKRGEMALNPEKAIAANLTASR